MSDGDIEQVIRQSAAAYGVDPDLLTGIAQAESGMNPGSTAKGSSAKGLFQFTDPTWKQYGKGDPLDAAAASEAGAKLTRANTDTLTGAGISPTPGAIYLAHFAGPGGAVKVLNADPSTPVASILGPEAVKANPFLAGMSAADLQAWADRKMGRAGSGGAGGSVRQLAQPQAAAPGGILGAVGGASGAPAPGILNDDGEALANLQQTLAALSARQAPAPVAQLAPIQMAVPKGISRSRLLAALSQPVGT
jgi:hypothetical protein